MAASPSFRLFDPGSDSVLPGTLEDLVRRYLTHLQQRCKVGDLQADVLDRYTRNLEHLIAWHNPEEPGLPRLGRLPIADAKQAHFADYLTAHLDRWRSGNTRRTKIGDVLSCLKWALDEEVIDYLPWHRPRTLSTKSQPRQEMREHHYRELLRRTGRKIRYKNQQVALKIRQGCFFLWHTGARPCEFRALEWDHIAWADRVARQHVGKTTRKTGFDRIIPLDDAVIRLLRYLERQKKPGQKFVFVNSRGKPWGRCEFQRRFVYYARLAGIPKEITTHSIRHGFACHEIRSGENPKAIADQLGHVDTRMVEKVYAAATRRDTERLAKAAEERLQRRRQQAAQARNQKRQAPAAGPHTKPPDATPLFDRLD